MAFIVFTIEPWPNEYVTKNERAFRACFKGKDNVRDNLVYTIFPKEEQDQSIACIFKEAGNIMARITNMNEFLREERYS